MILTGGDIGKQVKVTFKPVATHRLGTATDVGSLLWPGASHPSHTLGMRMGSLVLRTPAMPAPSTSGKLPGAHAYLGKRTLWTQITGK